MVEQYANNAETTINDAGGISAGDTTLVVTDGSVFPATTDGPFRIRIEDEIIKVTTRSTNTLTIVRGQEGTTAAAHADGLKVVHILTRTGLLGMSSNTVREGAISARPAVSAETEGRLWLPDNGASIYRDGGAGGLWTPRGPVYDLVEPIDGDFAWINQEGASVDTTRGGIVLAAPAIVSADLRIRKKAAPSTPYTITGAFIPSMPSDSGFFPGMGLTFRESGTGELVTFSYTLATTPKMRPQKWNSPTSFNAGYAPTWEEMNAFLTGDLVWQRIGDTGTNLTFEVSNDGRKFYQIFSVSRTDFMAGGPDEVGFWANAVTNYDIEMWLLHWAEA